MHRVVLSLLLAACWRGTTQPPVPPTPTAATPVAPVDETTDPVPCDRFDANNPSCKTTCPRDAPADWPTCREQTAVLLGRGYACTSSYPWSCTRAPTPACPPATQCRPVQARVIKLQVTGSDLVITIGAGSNQGITASWKATLTDANRNPVPGGGIKLETVHDAYTTGRVVMTPDQLHANPYVLLEP